MLYRTVPNFEHEEGDPSHSLFQPERSLSSAGTVSPSQLFPCSYHDVELPAMVTSDDFWEAAARCEGERAKEVAKIKALTARERSSVTACAVPQQMMLLKRLSAPSSSQDALCNLGTSAASSEECESSFTIADANLAKQRSSRNELNKSDIEKQKVRVPV